MQFRSNISKCIYLLLTIILFYKAVFTVLDGTFMFTERHEISHSHEVEELDEALDIFMYKYQSNLNW